MKNIKIHLIPLFLFFNCSSALFAEALVCTVSGPKEFPQDLMEPLGGFGYVIASVGPVEATLTLKTDSYDVSNVSLIFKRLGTDKVIYEKSWFFNVDPFSISSYVGKFVIEDTFKEPHDGKKISYICRVK